MASNPIIKLLRACTTTTTIILDRFEVLDRLPDGALVIGDKGFIGDDWKSEWTGINILTPYKENQKKQLPTFVQRLINGLRERIEGVYKVAKEGGRRIEHTLAHPEQKSPIQCNTQ